MLFDLYRVYNLAQSEIDHYITMAVGLRCVVLCTVLVVATAQIGTETTELEAQFASPAPRTPLSEAIGHTPHS